MTPVPKFIFLIVLVVFILIVLAVFLDRRKPAKKTRPRTRKKTLPAKKKSAPSKTVQQIPTEASLMRQQIVDLIKNDPERVRQAVQRWLREK